MVNYPYGRSSTGRIISYSDEQAIQNLKSVTGDDECHKLNKEEHNFIIRYDAPREDDTGRGHISIWVQFRGTEYNKCYLYTGDDGEVYGKYTKLETGESDIYDYINKQDVDTLMR